MERNLIDHFLQKTLERKWRARNGKEHVYRSCMTPVRLLRIQLFVIRKKNGGERECAREHEQCEQPSDCHVTWEWLKGETWLCSPLSGSQFLVPFTVTVLTPESYEKNTTMIWRISWQVKKWNKCIINLARQAGGTGCNDDLKEETVRINLEPQRNAN